MSAKEERIALAKEQLALDLGCSPAAFDRMENTIVPLAPRPGARECPGWDSELRVACFGKGAVAAVHPSRLFSYRAFFVGMEGSRLFDFSAMARLDGTLSKVGRGLGACRAFFLPGSFLPECPVPKGIAPRFLTRGETAVVRKTRLFPHALARESTALTLAGFEGEAVAGVAAAVVDSAQVWQIGVDVRPQSRGKRLGCFLVVNLTKEVLAREILPCYSTWTGNLFSKRLALSAGYFPAWLEMGSVKKR